MGVQENPGRNCQSGWKVRNFLFEAVRNSQFPGFRRGFKPCKQGENIKPEAGMRTELSEILDETDSNQMESTII